MICDICKVAGKRNGSDADAAKAIHCSCEHPATCPCQHRIGAILNMDRIRAASSALVRQRG